MKIGIFGDSYSSVLPTHTGLAWPSILEQDFEVENYSLPGETMQFIYSNFMDNYHKYDKVIVVPTYPIRFNSEFCKISSLPHLEFLKDKTTWTLKQTKILDAVYNYMVYALEDKIMERNHIMAYNAMIKVMQGTGKDILWIPAFHFLHSMWPSVTTLGQITAMEQTAWGSQWTEYTRQKGGGGDARQCHLTEENNLRLARLVKNKLPSLSRSEYLDYTLEDFAAPDDINRYKNDIVYDKKIIR